MSDDTETEPADIGMPLALPADPGSGWLPITDTSPPVDQDRDILLCIAWLEYGDDCVRTGRVVGWQPYVGRRIAADCFDKPESMACAPSADWLGADRDVANRPSFWQPAPSLPPIDAPSDGEKQWT